MAEGMIIFLFGFPIFITIYLFALSLYHGALYAIMSETKKSIRSGIWDNISYGNYWGVLLTIFTFLLLYKFYIAGVASRYIILAITFDVITHFLVLLTTYHLALPILKSLKILKKAYIPAFVGFPLVIFFSAKALTMLSFPGSRIKIVFYYVLFSLMIIFYFSSLMKIISGRYSDLGFVYKPFLIGSIGLVSYLISVLIIIFIILQFPTIKQLNNLYYYLFFYSALFTFTLLQFMRFVVDYPSAIQPKWKAYLPVDPMRLAGTITLAFLSISLYFTLKDLGIVVVIPGWALVISAVLFVPAAILFLYTRTFAGETTLGYWN